MDVDWRSSYAAPLCPVSLARRSLGLSGSRSCGPRSGWLFREDQLVRLRDAQTVFLTVVHDDHLALELKERRALEPARGRDGRRRRLIARGLHRAPRFAGLPRFGQPSSWY